MATFAGICATSTGVLGLLSNAAAAVEEFAGAEFRLLTSNDLRASSSDTLAVSLQLVKAKRIDVLPDCSFHVATAHHENTSRKRTGGTSFAGPAEETRAR